MVVVERTWWKVYIPMTISSAMNVLIKFIISITFSFAFSFSENDDMHLVRLPGHYSSHRLPMHGPSSYDRSQL